MSRITTSLKFLIRPGRTEQADRIAAYERAFAGTVLGDADIPCLAFWRGRVALWTILRAIGLKEGQEVLLPAFTCEMVPTAVRFAGGRCVFVDVAAGRFSPNAEDYALAMTGQSRAFLCQHTYGMAQPARTIRRLADKQQAVMVEDCCQCVTFPAAGEISTSGAASIFSTHWSKPYSTGLGGLASFNDYQLYRKAFEIRAGFSHDGDRRRERSLALQMLVHALTVRPMTKATVAGMYRWAQRTGLVRGTTTAEEYEADMPADYPAGATGFQSTIGLAELQRWRDNVSHRQELTRLYLAGLSAMGADISGLPPDDSPLWAVPLVVENKSELLRRSGRCGLPLATWFARKPVHVAPQTAGRYDYQPGQCPKSERLFHREVHLLTGPSVSLRRARAAMKMLRKHAVFSRM